MTKTASKSFSLSNSSQKLPFLLFWMYFLYDHPNFFKFKRKYQQLLPVFPDHLSVSYDYSARNSGIEMNTFIFMVLLAKRSECRRKYLLLHSDININNSFSLVVVKINVKVLGSFWVPYQQMFILGDPDCILTGLYFQIFVDPLEMKRI